MRPIALLALTALLAAPAAAKTTIKVATLAPKGSAFHKVLAELADTWKSESGGEVRLKIYPGGVAGDDAEVVRKIRLGTLHGALITAGGLREISLAAHALQIPLAYRSWDEYDYVLDKLRPTLDRIYREEGFEVLAWGDGGWIRLLSKKPIVTPEDAGTQKLFVFQGNPAQTALWRKTGFDPVPLPATEITTALQTGLIEAVPTTAQAAVLMRWNDHARHLTGAKWAPFVGALIVDREVWEALDPALRQTLAASAREAGDKLEALSRQTDEASVEEMAARGLTVHPIPPAAMKQWQAKVKSAEGDLRGLYVPTALYDEAMKHRDAFRKLGAFTDGTSE